MASVRKKSIVPFIGGSYEMLTKKISSQQCDNCYLEKQDGMNTKVQYNLVGTPGTKLWLDLEPLGLESVWCRGLFTSGQVNTEGKAGVLFGVFGSKLIRIDSPTDYTVISNAISGSSIGQVSFAESVFYLMIADGERMYYYNYSDETHGVVDYPDNAKPKQIAWIGNRMIAINSGSTDAQRNQVFYSAAPRDATDTSHVLEWVEDGAGNFSAIQNADPITTMQINNGYIWLFGSRSYELHKPTFDYYDPFDLIDSTTNAIGCSAPLGSTEIADTIFWLGSARAGTQQIFMSNGLSAVPISNSAIENQIADMYSKGIKLSDVNVYAYSQAGHVFAVFNFISANVCWVFDTSTKQWHSRSSYDNTTPSKDRWEYLWTTEFDDKVLTTAPNGKILELDINTYSDYDQITHEHKEYEAVATTDSSLYPTIDGLAISDDVDTTLEFNMNLAEHEAIFMFSSGSGQRWIQWDETLGQYTYHRSSVGEPMLIDPPLEMATYRLEFLTTGYSSIRERFYINDELAYTTGTSSGGWGSPWEMRSILTVKNESTFAGLKLTTGSDVIQDYIIQPYGGLFDVSTGENVTTEGIITYRQLGDTTYTYEDSTKPLVMEYTGPVYWDNLDKVVIDELQLDMEVGVGYGQPGDQSYDPEMVVETSRNGGESFRNSRLYKLGKRGEYSKTMRIRKLGMSREHVVRVRISDPVRRSIYGARLISVSAGN